MPGKWVEYKLIKEKVSIEDILERYGLLERFTRRGDQLSGACPIHKGHKKSQFSVNLAKNAFKCFSPDCGAQGNAIDFVSYFEGISFRQAAEMIQEWFDIKPEKGSEKKERRRAGTPAKKAEKQDKTEELKENKPLTFELNLDSKHEYLESRGLVPETIEYFGLGFCKRGTLKERVAIPIHDNEGKLIAYAGRWGGSDEEIPDGEGKYKLPAGFHKSLVVYNLHRIEEETKIGIIVEGFFPCFYLYQNGYKNVVSLMGSSISKEQAELLSKKFKGVQIFFDGDKAGQEGARQVAIELAEKMWVRIINCPEGLQPDRLPLHELKKLLA